MDRLTPEKRSALMRKVKGKDTGPELIVRRMLHGLGFRFRLHRKDLYLPLTWTRTLSENIGHDGLARGSCYAI